MNPYPSRPTVAFGSSVLGLLTCSVALWGAASVRAESVEYSFNDSFTDAGVAGSGVFTLDLGPSLMDYDATGVVGSGDTFGTWSAVTFRAVAGTLPSLVISNLVDASFSYSFPAIGGDSIQPGSQADLEWAHFIEQAAARGVQIAPVTTEASVVPEVSTWVSMVVLGLGLGGGWVCRRRNR